MSEGFVALLLIAAFFVLLGFLEDWD